MMAKPRVRSDAMEGRPLRAVRVRKAVDERYGA